MTPMMGIPGEMIRRYDRPGPRYTSYPTVPAWEGGFGEPEYREALRAVAARPEDTLSLYVHLPFCAHKCLYCGCNAVVTSRAEVVDAYLDRLERELDLVLEDLGRNRTVVQLHLGGGTPNYLNQAQRHRLINRLARDFRFADGAERSIELDPRLVDDDQICDLKALGFTRISLGVQDLDPTVQAAIGRMQPVELIQRVVWAVRDEGFDSLNLDLIYGLPRQSLAMFRHTLDLVLGLGPDRMALFGYAHVPGLRANQRLIREEELPLGETKFRLFELAVRTFEEGGYQWLGLDHFAKPGDELAIAAAERRLHRNFMGYTLRPADHLIGLGASSIGDLAHRFAGTDAKLGYYQRELDNGKLPITRGHRLSADDRRRRTAIMHLMCNLELPLDLPLDAGGTPRTHLAESLEGLAQHVEGGLITLEGDRYVVTPAGRYFLRNLCMELDAHLAKSREKAVFSRTV